MKKNKPELVSLFLFTASIILFLFVGFFIKESDAIPYLVFYIIIITCLACAFIIQIKQICFTIKNNKNKGDK